MAYRRAVILAGGMGTRLKPYTVVLPKPLMPIGEYPILEIVVRQLVRHGFNHITMAVNHQVDLIKAFFGDGKRWNTKIDYSIEDKPLGTMGPLRLIRDLPENFLVMNGDILTDLNHKNFFNEHIKNKNIFTISSFIREQVSEYGVLEVDDDRVLTGFREKPVAQHEVSMGIYMANREIIGYIPADKIYGFDSLMIRLISSDKKVRVHRHRGHWLDIGRHDDYAQAISEFQHKKKLFLQGCGKVEW